MIGHPKFNYGDKVKFKLDDKEVIGEIYIIDEHGIFADNSDVYYDIMCTFGNDKLLVKHVKETAIEEINNE